MSYSYAFWELEGGLIVFVMAFSFFIWPFICWWTLRKRNLFVLCENLVVDTLWCFLWKIGENLVYLVLCKETKSVRLAMEGLKVSDANLIVYVHPSKSTKVSQAVLRELSSLLFKYFSLNPSFDLIWFFF